MTPTPAQIAKLPKWAQQYVRTLRRERDEAVNTMIDLLGKRTESRVYYDEFLPADEPGQHTFKRVFMDTRRVTMEWAGVRVELAQADGGLIVCMDRADCIGRCAIAPSAGNSFQVVPLP